MLVVTVSGSAIEFLRPRGGLPHRRAPRRAHPQALAQAAPGPNGLHKIQMPDLLSTYPTCVPKHPAAPKRRKTDHDNSVATPSETRRRDNLAAIRGHDRADRGRIRGGATLPPLVRVPARQRLH